MQEIWKDIKGYKGSYQINNLGRVKSFIRKGRILKPAIGTSGYYHLVLCLNGKTETFRIHRLIAQHFITNKYNKPCINHKNGIKTDNRIKNLEWCIHKENSKHAMANGLSKHAVGEQSSKSKLTKNEVIEIREKHSSGLYTIRELSKEYNVCYSTISRIIKYTYWKHVL